MDRKMISPPISHPKGMLTGMGNCGIVAMAICANVEYMVAHEWFRNRQRPRGNWRGATYHRHYGEFLREHGVWFEQVDYGKDRQRLVGDFVKWGAKPGRLYAIRSAGHLMVCLDGWVADQHRVAHIDDGKFWKRNARLKNHWEIFR